MGWNGTGAIAKANGNGAIAKANAGFNTACLNTFGGVGDGCAFYLLYHLQHS